VTWIATGPNEFGVGPEHIRRLLALTLEGTSHRNYTRRWATVGTEGDAAWASGEITIGARAGGRDIALPFRFSGTFVRIQGRWRIANFHQSVGDARQLGDTWDSLMDTVATEVRREQPPLAQQAAPDGMVTLLFTDIADSTGMAETLGDLRWMEILHLHNEIVRERVGAYGGFEVKTIGDAFMLAFQSARRAVLCAIDIQRAFSAYNREYVDAPLAIRVGLHAGEPVRDADDFYGKSVILASRIAGGAQAGEVLVSSLLRELVEAAGDIEFGAAREVELKGFAGTHRLFPVRF
jgi:class 3 adenylate cyclase